VFWSRKDGLWDKEQLEQGYDGFGHKVQTLDGDKVPLMNGGSKKPGPNYVLSWLQDQAAAVAARVISRPASRSTVSALDRRQGMRVAGQQPTAVGLLAVDGDPMTRQFHGVTTGVWRQRQRVPAQRVGHVANDSDLFRLADAADPELLVGTQEAVGVRPARTALGPDSETRHRPPSSSANGPDCRR